MSGREVDDFEAAKVINEMRLCERMNISPRELAEMPLQKVLDWQTVIRYEGEIAEAERRQADSGANAR